MIEPKTMDCINPNCFYSVSNSSLFWKEYILSTKRPDSKFKSRLPDWLLWTGTPIKKKPDLGGWSVRQSSKREGQSLKPKMLPNFVSYSTPGGCRYVTQGIRSLFRLILFTEQQHVGRELEELIRNSGVWSWSQ